MTAGTATPYRAGQQPGPERFGHVLRAEWTKFRTVRGWVAGVLISALVMILLGLFASGSVNIACNNGPGTPTHTGRACLPRIPTGPGGEAVTDSFYFVHRPLAGDGSITVRVTSLSGASGVSGVSGAGLQPWSKAGIIIKASFSAGSAYAAMMVTGSHGVRMQWDYTGDAAGLGGAVSAVSPRWLRLTRSGDTITGYDSPDGAHWIFVARASLTGLPATVPAGLFAASPAQVSTTSQSAGSGSGSGGPTEATAAFDGVTLRGAAGAWTGTAVGSPGVSLPGFRPAGGALVVSGSGDIAPVPASGEGSVANTLVGAFAGLIAIVVVAAMFITAEFRRGLIRVTLTASPRRSRILAAKAIVVGSFSFAVGLAAAFAAMQIEEPLARSRGIFIDPVPALTEVRVVAGTAALLAVAAVLALALGAALRRSAVAVTAAIAVIVLPYFFAEPLALLPAGAADWLLRVTPAAGFAIQQPYPAYPQVNFGYTPGNGYYPLAPWAGFAVLCAWTAAALGLATYRLCRSDA